MDKTVNCQRVYPSVDHLSVLTSTVLVTPPKEDNAAGGFHLKRS